LGKDANVKAAQQALLHRAQCNRAARRGEYNSTEVCALPANL
jgi:fructose-bisphosphate aldolase, class I